MPDEASKKRRIENERLSRQTPLLFEGEMGVAHEPEFNGVRRRRLFSAVFLRRGGYDSLK